MADPFVEEVTGIFTATVGSTAVNAGALVYFDGTDWELAEADDNTKFAEAIATNDFASGDVGVFCTACIITDIDAPYTQGQTQYLHTTAGSLTTTRLTGGNNLVQVVGFALSTSQLRMEISIPRELSIWVDLPYAQGSAAVTADGDWSALSMTADNDAAHGVGIFPNNTVALKEAFLWIYNEDALAGGNYTLDISAGVSDEAGTAHVDETSATAVPVTTADDLVRADVSSGFEASGLVDAGNHFGIDVSKTGETGADDYRFHGVEVIVMVV